MESEDETEFGFPEGSNGLNLVNFGDLIVNEPLPSYLRSRQTNKKKSAIEQTFKDVCIAEAPKLSYFNTYIKNDFKAFYSRMRTRQRASISKQRLVSEEENKLTVNSSVVVNQNPSFNSSKITSPLERIEALSATQSKLQQKRIEFQLLRESMENEKFEMRSGNKRKQQLIDDLCYLNIFADKSSRLTKECVVKVASIKEKKQLIVQNYPKSTDVSPTKQAEKPKEINQEKYVLPVQDSSSSSPSTEINNSNTQTQQNEDWKQIYDPTIEIPSQLRRTSLSEVNTKQNLLTPRSESGISIESKTIQWNENSKDDTFSLFKSQRQFSSLLSTPRKRAFSLSKSFLRKNEGLSQPISLLMKIEGEGLKSTSSSFESKSQQAKIRCRVLKSTSQEGRPSTCFEMSRQGQEVKPFQPFENCKSLGFQPKRLETSPKTQDSTLKVAKVKELQDVDEKRNNIMDQYDVDFSCLDSEFLRQSHVSHKSIMYAAKVLKNKFGIIRLSEKPS